MRRKDPTPCCGAKAGWSARWDRFFCSTCRAWISPRCKCAPDDPECYFKGDCPPDATGIEDGAA